jgi:TetR/AcrR family transcriptional repressor of lmrAB and yxaGH operons
VSLEVAATNDVLQEICGGIYARWQRALAGSFLTDSHAAADAEDLAATALALIEGALVLARASRSHLPVEQAGRRLAKLIGAP